MIVNYVAHNLLIQLKGKETEICYSIYFHENVSESPKIFPTAQLSVCADTRGI